MPIDEAMIRLYAACAKHMNWGPREVDEANFETLMQIWAFLAEENKNNITIAGQTYRLASNAPAWML